jgi:hypothetical protein
MLQLALLKKKSIIKFKTSFVDGRLNSMQAEAVVIKHIQEVLAHSAIINIPSARSWHDISIQWPNIDVPYYFNIKVSTGGQDNAFNKKALVWSLSTLLENDIPNAMSINTMHNLIMQNHRTMRSAKNTGEYYFLYVDKHDGTIVIKSLCDIQSWASNSQNILQINWTKEKQRATTSNGRLVTPIRNRIFKLISTSLQNYYASCDQLLKYPVV